MENMDRGVIKDLWESRFIDWEVLGVRGTAEGVVVIWDSHLLAKVAV